LSYRGLAAPQCSGGDALSCRSRTPTPTSRRSSRSRTPAVLRSGPRRAGP